MSATRLILKQPTGWFAAGREVAQALSVLSDGAFKLYIQLCLQADRHTGRAGIQPGELARILRKPPALIEANLAELQHREVCECREDGAEICDRFWPYQKQNRARAADPQAAFVREAREALLKPACVCSAFTAADEKLAVQLWQRGVSLKQLRRAIWLGCARKYMAMLNGQTRQFITSLAYFAALFDEVAQPHIPASYWEHVRRKTEELEQLWLETGESAPARM